MSDVSQNHIDTLLDKVRANYAQRDFARVKLHKLLFWVVILLVVLFVSALGAIYYLSMLKEKEVKAALVLLDGKDGVVQQVKYLDPTGKISNEDAIVKSYAYDYVQSRYGYFWVGSTDTLKTRYERVLAFTAPEIKATVANEISSRNPESPYNTLGEKGAVEISNVSITPMSGNRVQVNFKSTVKKDNTSKVFSYTALGSYAWHKTDGMSIDERSINPLGFVFTEWALTQNASNDLVAPAQSTQPTVQPSATVTPIDPATIQTAPAVSVTPAPTGQPTEPPTNSPVKVRK